MSLGYIHWLLVDVVLTLFFFPLLLILYLLISFKVFTFICLSVKSCLTIFLISTSSSLDYLTTLFSKFCDNDIFLLFSFTELLINRSSIVLLLSNLEDYTVPRISIIIINIISTLYTMIKTSCKSCQKLSKNHKLPTNPISNC